MKILNVLIAAFLLCVNISYTLSRKIRKSRDETLLYEKIQSTEKCIDAKSTVEDYLKKSECPESRNLTFICEDKKAYSDCRANTSGAIGYITCFFKKNMIKGCRG